MKKTQLLVPARYYLRLSEVLTPEQLDFAQLIRELHLPPTLLTEPDATLSQQQVERLLDEVCRRTGRTDLGFRLGRLLTVSAHSFVGFGMLNSPNVEQALYFVARYFRLVMPSFRLRYVRGAGFGELHFTPAVAMSHQCLLFHLEAIGMAALREVRDLSDGLKLDAVLSLSMPAPSHAALYRGIPNLTTQFEVDQGPAVRLRVAADLGAIPLTTADTNALKVAEDRCRQLIQKVTTVGRLGDLITMTLSETGEQLATQGEIAGLFNISTRTLNRYLQRENTSFREIARQVQHSLARDRLKAGIMPITEIAFSLGFSDAANFTRAFRAVEGCSPSEFRRGLRPAKARA